MLAKPKRTEETKAATNTLISKVNLHEYNNSVSPTNKTTMNNQFYFGKGGSLTQNGFYHTMLQKQQQGMPRLVKSISQKTLNSTASFTLPKKFGY